MIDPSIPLQVRTPQIQDPMESYGRMLQLKNMLQQGQMGDVQLQTAQLQQQQAQQDAQDQQIIRQAYGEVGGDLDKLHAAVAGKVSPKAAQAIKTAAYEQRQKLLTLNKDEFDLKSKKLDQMGNTVNGLLQMDDQSMAEAWPQIRIQALQSGDIDPQMVPEQFPGRDAVQMYANMIDGGKAARDRAKAERETAGETRAAAESAARLPGIQAETTKKVAEVESMQTWLARPENAGKTAADYEAYIEEEKAKARHIPTPGVDIPYSPDVEKQKIRIAEREARIKKNTDTAEDIGDYADAVASGQMEITAVPMKVRGAVVGAIKESGQLIVSAKERDAIKSLDVPLTILDDIEKYSKRVNNKSGLWARITGGGRILASKAGWDPDVTLLRSKIGTLSLLIRALGEKGNLAEGDVTRAIQTIPGVMATEQEAKAKIEDIRGILQGAKNVQVKGTSQTFKKDGTAAITTNAPAIGTIDGGYKFKGGNPADPANWEKVAE